MRKKLQNYRYLAWNLITSIVLVIILLAYIAGLYKCQQRDKIVYEQLAQLQEQIKVLNKQIQGFKN